MSEILQKKINFKPKNKVEYSRILEISTENLVQESSDLIFRLFKDNKENVKK